MIFRQRLGKEKQLLLIPIMVKGIMYGCETILWPEATVAPSAACSFALQIKSASESNPEKRQRRKKHRVMRRFFRVQRDEDYGQIQYLTAKCNRLAQEKGKTEQYHSIVSKQSTDQVEEVNDQSITIILMSSTQGLGAK